MLRLANLEIVINLINVERRVPFQNVLKIILPRTHR